MRNKLLSITIAAAMAAPISALPASAASVTEAYNNEAVAFLDDFLGNLKDGNYDDALLALNDERCALSDGVDVSKLSEQEAAYVSYTESGQAFIDEYEKETIDTYEILDVYSDDVIRARINFADGSTAIVPFCIDLDGGEYKVHITTMDLDDYGYNKLTSANTSNSESTSDNAQGNRSTIWKDDYTFSYLYGTIYGIDSFSVSQNAIRIDGYQANYMLSSGWLSEAEVIYSVVVKHWYGDDVWATTSNAIKKNGNFSITIVGENSSQSDLVIRIANQTGAYPRSEGNGSLYSVSV